jgi:tRNA-splicing ligase RtcB
MKMIELNKLDKPNKIYAEVVEDGAITQFISAMETDFAIRGALMPDVHQGYSLPIGAVVETKNIVVPSWVGYDIGCGMCAVPTSFHVGSVRDNADLIYNQIIRDIPVGFNKHSIAVEDIHKIDRDPNKLTQDMSDIFIDRCGYFQLGTLGGGNHFIEIGVDQDDVVWIIIHSGSRGVGHGCATHYMKKASPTGKASEGHYGFHVDSEEGQNYILDMNFCLEYALLNRKTMMKYIIKAIQHVGVDGSGAWNCMINRNHNHAESKDGVHWIHRKGATHAENGMLGVIPGNMRDGSFIVKGLGNEDALCSSSHGAGRVLGRRKAKETLDLDVFKGTMEGIVANVASGTLDESPMAYKNIFDVMRLQEGLVDIITHIKPIINVKG